MNEQLFELLTVYTDKRYRDEALYAPNKKVYLSKEEQLQRLQELLAAGANTHAINPFDGNTPLHHYLESTVRFSELNPRIVELLIRSGANVNALDYRLKTPFQLATYYYNQDHQETNDEILLLMLQAGADLHYRAYRTFPTMNRLFTMFVEHGYPIDYEDKKSIDYFLQIVRNSRDAIHLFFTVSPLEINQVAPHFITRYQNNEMTENQAQAFIETSILPKLFEKKLAVAQRYPIMRNGLTLTPDYATLKKDIEEFMNESIRRVIKYKIPVVKPAVLDFEHMTQEELDQRLLNDVKGMEGNYLRKLLDAGANPNARTFFTQDTFLTIGPGDSTRFIMENGADLNIQDIYGIPPVFLHDDDKLLQDMIESGANIYITNPFGERKLDELVQQGDWFSADEGTNPLKVLVTTLSPDEIKSLISFAIILKYKLPQEHSIYPPKDVRWLLLQQAKRDIIDKKLAFAKQYLPDAPEEELIALITASLTRLLKKYRISKANIAPQEHFGVQPMDLEN